MTRSDAPRDADPPLEIRPDELRQRLAEAGDPLLLLDVRRAEERLIGRIDPSLHIPMDDVPARLHELGEIDEPIVVYCHLGRRSLHVALFLRQQGFTDVRSLAGGMDLWERSA